MPSFMDPTMTAPATFNGVSYLPVTQSGWPVSASPSDAAFDYDGRYQLVGEERDYVTGAEGDDLGPDGEKRLRSVRWDFDPRGNMVSWAEEADAGGAAVANLGRALGGTIENGWQLNAGTQCGVDPAATGCFIPDAIYFATNVGDAGIPGGRGTCVWASYDASGRMVQQTVRTGCMSCTREGGPVGASCDDRAQEGMPGETGYLPALTAERTDYLYAWNAYSQLVGAHKYVNIDTPLPDAGDLPDVVMTYLYDAGGNRVVREQSNIAVGEEEIYQDVYLGSLERRHVQLLDGMGIARSIHSAQEGLHFVNVGDTRQVHYAAGARLQWKVPSTGGVLGATPQIFLSFSNHLGSTSAVIDYESGALVEWNTYYAYGADESRWKNTDAQYDNAEEPYGFTGKEEDDAVGLHYFGARYYSSHLGRWLTPDPPVIHGGGLGNYYNYGGNSPYIYVDPDGNSVVALIVGAIVGAVAGAISAAASGGGVKEVMLGALVGAVGGLVTGGAGAAASAAGASAAGVAMAGAGASAAFSMTTTALQGGTAGQVFLSGAISFGSGMIGAGMGAIAGPASSMAGAFGQKALSFVTGLATSYGAAALTGGVNKENWDDILISYSVNFAVSSAGDVVGQEIEAVRFERKVDPVSRTTWTVV